MSETKLTRHDNYPVADEYRTVSTLPIKGPVRAKWSGITRRPRKGEWYLSGAIIAAYLAPSNLDYGLPIAELYHAKQKTEWVLSDEPFIKVSTLTA